MGNKWKNVNLYFQDESRFGLKTHVGRCLTARGVKPIVQYQHAFKNTYLYGSFSPINGDSFVYEIEGTTSEIFYEYIKAFPEYKKNEMKNEIFYDIIDQGIDELSDIFKKNEGSWKFKDLGDGRTQVDYSLEVEIKGFAPKTLVNSLTEKNLPAMLKSYHERCKA